MYSKCTVYYYVRFTPCIIYYVAFKLCVPRLLPLRNTGSGIGSGGGIRKLTAQFMYSMSHFVKLLEKHTSVLDPRSTRYLHPTLSYKYTIHT